MFRIAPQSSQPPQPPQAGGAQAQPPPELLAALAQAQSQGGSPAAPDPTQSGDPGTQPDPTQDPTQSPDNSPQMIGHKIPAMLAGYMGPEYGPFACGKCRFFEAPNSCSVVDGSIDPAGCCNNFTPASMSSQAQGSEDTDSDAAQEPDADEDDNSPSDTTDQPTSPTPQQ